jgi:hypothetical protein
MLGFWYKFVNFGASTLGQAKAKKGKEVKEVKRAPSAYTLNPEP